MEAAADLQVRRLETHKSEPAPDLRSGVPSPARPVLRRAVRTMFKTLQTELLIGLTPLLAIMVALGLWAIVMFSRLGNNIDVILRENYQSVLAAEGMKEALERMDSALLFALAGEQQQARDQFAEYRPVFE